MKLSRAHTPYRTLPYQEYQQARATHLRHLREREIPMTNAHTTLLMKHLVECSATRKMPGGSSLSAYTLADGDDTLSTC